MFRQTYRELLSEIRENRYTLEVFDLKYSEMTDNDISVLAEALKHNTYIQKIVLANNLITDTGVEILVALKRDNACSIKSIDLSENIGISGKGAELLAGAKFEEILLDGTPIGDSVEHFSHCSSLKSLSVSNCDITDAGAAKVLNNRSINKLNLQSNKITGEALKNISSNNSLQLLYLDANPIEDLGSECLGKQRSIRLLSLNKCGIGDAGLENISRGLPLLEELYVMNNKASDKGAVSLSSHSRLRKVSLFKNNVGNQGAIALCNGNIEDVDLAYNQIDVQKISKEMEKALRKGMRISVQGNANAPMVSSYQVTRSELLTNGRKRAHSNNPTNSTAKKSKQK